MVLQSQYFGHAVACSHFEQVFASMQCFREDHSFCDTVIQGSSREFKAHSVVLAAASSVLKSTLQKDGSPGITYRIKLQEVEDNVIEIALHYIYTGELLLPSVFVSEMSGLLVALNKLGLEPLKFGGCKIQIKSQDDSKTLDEGIFSNGNTSAAFNALECIDTKQSEDDYETDQLELLTVSCDIDMSTSKILSNVAPNEMSMIDDNVMNNFQIETLFKSSNDNQSPKKRKKRMSSRKRKTSKSDPNNSKLDVSRLIEENTEICCQETGSDNIKPVPVERKKILKKEHICSICNKVLSSKSSLIMHSSVHTGAKPYMCSECGKEFTSLTNMQRHAKSHTGVKSHICDMCGKGFTRRSNLEEHIVRYHMNDIDVTNPGSFNIDVTNIVATNVDATNTDATTMVATNTDATTMVATNTDATNMVATNSVATNMVATNTDATNIVATNTDATNMVATNTDATNMVATNTDATNMVATNTVAANTDTTTVVATDMVATNMVATETDATYKCTTCNVSFPFYSALRNHKAQYHGNMHLCSFCGKGFSKAVYLKIHIRLHTGEKPYACSICEKRFSSKKSLKQHGRCHNEKKQGNINRAKDGPCYICVICGKGYTIAHNLRTHTRSVHFGEKPHICSYCGRGFSAKTVLQDHLRIHTDEKPYACEICLKNFRCKSAWRLHRRIHTGEKPFKCKICMKEFRQVQHLKRHHIVHTGEKPYSCSMCEKSYSQRTDLRIHCSRVHQKDLHDSRPVDSVPLACLSD